MILLQDILRVHQFSIEKFGESNGTRDQGSLASAIARPFQSFDSKDLYPTIFEKAAALGESLIINHPLMAFPCTSHRRKHIFLLLKSPPEN
jgi:death-on-curing protein